MKTLEELEVGKWYTSNYWRDENSYAKFLNGSLERFYFSESIRRDYWKETVDWWGASNFAHFREVPLEEIQKYLPDGHPDKIIKKGLIGRYVKCLRDVANGCQVNNEFVKKGEYYQIGSIVDDNYRLKDGNYCGHVDKLDSHFEDLGFELMPEGFTPTKELTELPEKWCIKVTSESLEDLGKWRSQGPIGRLSPDNKSPSGYCSHGDGYWTTSKPDGCTEISYEQFKKWVLKEDSSMVEDKLPEQWYFKVTHENYEKFKDIRSLSRVYGYISSNPVYDLSWGFIYSDPPLGYTEISFEAFEKHVLSKEKSKTISSKPEKPMTHKFKKGDKVRIPVSKKGNLWYKNNVSELDDYHKDYFIISDTYGYIIGLTRDDHKVFIENSFYEEDLVLYTEPTKEEWVPKVGDWVWDTVNKKYLRIKNFDTVGDLILEKQGGTYKSQCRKAEPWEIPIEEQTTTISTVGVPSGGIYISGRDPYDHYPSPKEIRDKYYLHRDLNISKPLTPKESFKTTKLPTKSWY